MLRKVIFLAATFSSVYGAPPFTAVDTKSIAPQPSSCPQCGKGLSQAFVTVAKSSRPAVVHIRVELNKDGSPDGYNPFGGDPSNPFEQFQDELFHRFFGIPPHGANPRAPQQKQAVSSGSGFIVSSDGYIVTNYHVVKEAGVIIVEKFDDTEKSFEAELVGCDPNTDLAILKIPGEGLPYLDFADSDEIDVGQWSMAIGHPFKLRDSVTVGVVSATHRGDLQISKWEDFIQTDTPINAGNSGGPLIDLNGKVIGVNTAILSRTGGNIGVGFAIPSNIAKMVFEQIRQNGVVDRAFLGVQIQDLNEDLCTGFHLKKGTVGALVTEVVLASSAEQAGLEPGDVITEFNGEPIKSAKQLYTKLGKLPSGSICNITVLRSGKTKQIKLTLGSKAKESSTEGDIIYKLGIVVEPISPETAHRYGAKAEEKGIVVTKVLPGSLASRAGWTVGSIIMVVNGQKINSVQDLKAVLEKAKAQERLVFLMHHQGRASFHSVPHPNA
jgi:serine protease Do